MPFCRCGILCLEDKCQSCGFDLKSVRQNSVDRWQSRYLDSVVGIDDLSSTDEESFELRLNRSPRVQNSMSPIMKRLTKNFNSLLDSRKVAPTKIETSPSPVTKKVLPKTNQNACTACNEKLSGKTVRLPDSQLKYHWACLKCKSCSMPFEDTSFYIDSQNDVHHPNCAQSLPGVQDCSRCSLAIKDKYLLINTQTLHPNCFRCTDCHKILHPTSIYTEKNGSFCQSCSNEKFPAIEKEQISEHMKIVPQLQYTTVKSITLTTSPVENSPYVQRPNASTPQVKPSFLMSSRGRPLPKFGVVKDCAGCGERIYSVLEETPGPKASKWHKKCLACKGCSKKLDSGATVYENEKTGKLAPWCTTCLLSKKNKGIGSTLFKFNTAPSTLRNMS